MSDAILELRDVVDPLIADLLTDALTVFNSASLAKVASKLLEKASLAVTLPASEELKVVVDPEIAVALAAEPVKAMRAVISPSADAVKACMLP